MVGINDRGASLLAGKPSSIAAAHVGPDVPTPLRTARAVAPTVGPATAHAWSSIVKVEVHAERAEESFMLRLGRALLRRSRILHASAGR